MKYLKGGKLSLLESSEVVLKCKRQHSKCGGLEKELMYLITVTKVEVSDHLIK